MITVEEYFPKDFRRPSDKRLLLKEGDEVLAGLWLEEAKELIERLQSHLTEEFLNGNNKTLHIGQFTNLEEAAEARKTAEQKYWGRIYSNG